MIGLILGSGLVYLVARTVGGGQGNFMTQTYLYALYTFPLAILSVLVSWIGTASAIFSLAIGIYELVLTYYMVQPAHRISADKARQVVFIVFVIGAILVLLLFFTLLSALFSSRGF